MMTKEYPALYDTDYDLYSALHYNGHESTIDRHLQTLAVIEGEYDGAAWHWIVQLTGPNAFAYITGWCDFTGWDCQSSCDVIEGNTLNDVLAKVEYAPDRKTLYEQIDTGMVRVTWREQIRIDNPDFDMPIVDLIARNEAGHD